MTPRVRRPVDDVLADLEKVCRMISSETFTTATSSAITSLSFHMKMMGHQLEGICKGASVLGCRCRTWGGSQNQATAHRD